MLGDRIGKPLNALWTMSLGQWAWTVFLPSRIFAPIMIVFICGVSSLLVVNAADDPNSYKQDTILTNKIQPDQKRSDGESSRLLTHGRYLASIAVCAACHTPPAVSDEPPAATDQDAIDRERRYKTDPDWFAYLDPAAKNHLAGGVPFILRIPDLTSFATVYGTVVTSNLTPDSKTGLGRWSESQIMRVLREGVRPDGSKLFLFPPHTFFKNLSDEDALALAVYLKRAVPPISRVTPKSTLPTEVVQQYWDIQNPKPSKGSSPPPKPPTYGPQGRSIARAQYLTSSLVGCMECHSYNTFDTGKAVLHPFVGGDPADPYQAVFRLGPDLPLRPKEKGFATFPYPGYAILYGGNLTRFGLGGDLHHVSTERIVRAMRQGISTEDDAYGRQKPLSHAMLWQFFATMTDDDAYSIAEFLKTLTFIPHELPSRLIFYGEDWEAAFEKVFGSKPTAKDREVFGKE